MELKLRKLILNTPMFDGGADQFNAPETIQTSFNKPKVLFSGYGTIPSMNVNNPNTSFNAPETIQTSLNGQNVGINGDQKKKLSGGFNVGGLIAASSTLMSDLTNAYNMAFNQPKADLIVSNTPEANNNVMGINYKRLGDIDEKSYLSSQNSLAIAGTLGATANGAMTGASIGGPWGALVGGVVGAGLGITSSLLGRNKLKKNLAKAKLVRNRINAYNLSGAMSTALLNNYYLEYGSNTGRLYANRGKDLKKPIL